MEWSNEKSLEFLELLQLETCLWDPKLQSHKNRSAINDAWRRIIQSLSFPTTLEKLKKKKDSLMGYYRIHLNKYKRSLKSGAGKDDVYKTNWFAFELMDSFLKPIYRTESIINTETSWENNTNKCINESPEEVSQTAEEVSQILEEVAQTASNPGLSTSTGLNRRNNESLKRPRVQYQKSKSPPEIVHAKKQMDDAFERLELITRRNREQLDEYDHFSFMIAAKIRKLQNFNDREILMNSIQNMVFEFSMQNKQSTTPAQSASPPFKSPSSVQSHPIYQFQQSHNGNIISPQMEQYQNSPVNLSYELTSQDTNYPQQSTTMMATPSPIPRLNDTSQRILSISESEFIQILSDEIIVPATNIN